MSLMKWILFTAGTAAGVRYMSDRHRQRLAQKGGHTETAAPGAQNTAHATQGGGHAVADGGPANGASHDDLLAPDTELAPGSSAGRF